MTESQGERDNKKNQNLYHKAKKNYPQSHCTVNVIRVHVAFSYS